MSLAMKPSEGGEAVAPLLAATVLLVRDGPRGLEVFMVVRHHKIEFASGALVFPGGKAEPEDSQLSGGWRLRGDRPYRGDPRDVRGMRRACSPILQQERGPGVIAAISRTARSRRICSRRLMP